jgi:imidazolonepropionase-like amidohydrolase
MLVMNTTVLLGKMLIDGTGAEPIWDPVILLQGDRIIQVLAKKDLSRSTLVGMDVLDYSDKALLPGLIDSHVHLCFTPGPDHEWVRESVNKDADRGFLPYRALSNAQQALKGGITTLRDSGDVRMATLPLRDAIQQGVVLGPRLIVSGMPITTTKGHLNYCGLVADTDPEINAAVEMLCNHGVDWVKAIVTGGVMTKESNPLDLQYGIEQLTFLVEQARSRGRKVEAHILNTAAIEAGVRAGVAHIAHCTWRDGSGHPDFREDLVEEIVHEGIYVEMTVSGFYRRLLPKPEATPEDIQAKLEEIRSFYASMKKMWSAGVKIILHSDAGVRLTDFNTFSQGLRLASLALELPAMDIILAATKYPAEALGLASDVGTITPGKMADIIAVEMNPLEDIGKIGEIAMVMKGGKIVVANGNFII